MSLLDPAERTAAGVACEGAVLAVPASQPATLLEESWRDFIFAEVWTRPGLDRRSRYLISLAGASYVGDIAACERYAHGALANKELTVAELREAALHNAVYSGWSAGGIVDRAITAAVQTLGLEDAPRPPIRAEAWDPDARQELGDQNFRKHMLFGGPVPGPGPAYLQNGILNFVFGEMWDRPGLDQRSRRWITLVGVANSSSEIPIGSHTWAAMASGNASREEMYEFVLQYAIHAGWPRGSVMQSAVLKQADRVEKGLPYQP